MSKSNRAEPVVLEYSRFNTVYERQEHDKALLQSLDNLAKISRDLVNPLSSYDFRLSNTHGPRRQRMRRRGSDGGPSS